MKLVKALLAGDAYKSGDRGSRLTMGTGQCRRGSAFPDVHGDAMHYVWYGHERKGYGLTCTVHKIASAQPA